MSNPGPATDVTSITTNLLNPYPDGGFLGPGTSSATLAQINSVAYAAARIVAQTTATLAVTADLHANRVVNLARAAGVAVTLPAATGTGNVYTFIIGTSVTSNSTTIKVANTSDAMQGRAFVISDNAAAVLGYNAVAGTSDTITFNGTTTGGLIGDLVQIMDMATNVFQVNILSTATGTEATPFSATV